jgi:transcriptional regulator with XRE-family HTH domain
MKLTTYANLEDMIRGTSDDPAEAERRLENLRRIELSAKLFALRNVAGLSQGELAERIGWTQSKLSRFEHKEDADISLGELQEYLGGLGRRAVVTIAEALSAQTPKSVRKPSPKAKKAKSAAAATRKALRS